MVPATSAGEGEKYEKIELTQETRNLLAAAANSTELDYEQIKELVVALTGGELYVTYSDLYYDNTGYAWNESIVLSAERANEAVESAERVTYRNGKEGRPIIGYETLDTR